MGLEHNSFLLLCRWDYPWTPNVLGNDLPFSSSRNLREITELDCTELLGCGVPVHRFRLKGALKNKWLNSGIFEGDVAMDNKVAHV